MCIIKLALRQILGFEIPSIWHYHTSQLGCALAWRNITSLLFFPIGHFTFSCARQPLGMACISSKWKRNFTLDSLAAVSLVRCTQCIGFPPTTVWNSAGVSARGQCVPVRGAVGLMSTGKSEILPCASLTVRISSLFVLL